VRTTSDFVMALVGFRDPYVSFSVMRGQQSRIITVERQGAEHGAH